MGDAGVTADDTVLCERRGAAGLITLNRPKALNALTLEMVRAMRRALDAWAADPAVTRVVVQGAGERAFCAGGDIRRIHEEGNAGRYAEAETFFREEYELNALIQRYPKPYIALIDGIVMGGGVGVSLHGSHRVAAERTTFAMPETGIGFFPDVGATHALPRLPGFVGTYLALTGERIGQGDVLAFGLATHAAAAARFPEIRDALAEGGPVEAAIGAQEAPAPGRSTPSGRWSNPASRPTACPRCWRGSTPPGPSSQARPPRRSAPARPPASSWLWPRCAAAPPCPSRRRCGSNTASCAGSCAGTTSTRACARC